MDSENVVPCSLTDDEDLLVFYNKYLFEDNEKLKKENKHLLEELQRKNDEIDDLKSQISKYQEPRITYVQAGKKIVAKENNKIESDVGEKPEFKTIQK